MISGAKPHEIRTDHFTINYASILWSKDSIHKTIFMHVENAIKKNKPPTIRLL